MNKHGQTQSNKDGENGDVDLSPNFLTARSRFLLEKLTGPHLDKKFPAFY